LLRAPFLGFRSGSGLVILLSHQTALNIVIGRSEESSPLRAAARQISKGNLDLRRQIARKQLKLAFGAGIACTKAFQTKKPQTLSSRTALAES
jgi:hypothetical protein